MRHFVEENQRNWDSLVPFATWVMNTSKNETTKFSPFELVYGRTPVQPLDLEAGQDPFEQIHGPSEYAQRIEDWLAKARKIAR